jgi:hypothetical protein
MEQPKKKRSGCLTVWIIWSVIAFLYLTLFKLLPQAYQEMKSAKFWPEDFNRIFVDLIVPVSIYVLAIVSFIALYRWKRWGFWGICLVSLVSSMGNYFQTQSLIFTLVPLTGVALLYGILQIGDKDKGWPQLE